MQPIRSVTVYCSSSRHVAAPYFEAASALGGAIAHKGWTLVYGGNDLGLMGALASAVREAGGKVVGITPQLLVDQGLADEKCDELIVTAGMRDRKALLEQRGDAFIALPGGLGTLEEIFEILVGKALGYHAKPIVVLNIDGFYDPLLAMIEHAIVHRFIKPRVKQLFQVATGVEDAIQYLSQAPPAQPPSAVPAPSSAAE